MKLAILGGGQLGRMLGLAAVPLGVECRFLDPSSSAGAGAVGELHVGALDDIDAIAQVVDGCDAITYEWEGVPARALEPFVDTHFVAPPLRALARSQDRVAEKTLANSLGLGTAPWCPVDSIDELRAALDDIGTPAILKTRSGGYDGKGQVRISSPADTENAWKELDESGPLVLEGFVDFARELSVIGCRGRDGAIVVWPVAQNHHDRGILRESRVPVDVSTQARADALIRRLLTELDYIGVLCAELFDVGTDLLVNEFAPRVHNSGHWTIEGSVTSQFANHVRAVLGLPLGLTNLASGPTVMLNCVGRMPDARDALAIPGAHLHDYGKSPRSGRKVGHLTLVAPDEETLEERLVAARAVIRDDG
jgi:5-(carboxyamino)imidazole ribonucleotide synthase